MKTIKIPYKTNEDLSLVLKQYSFVVRYKYNRFLDDNIEKNIRELTKSLNNIDLLNSLLIQCGIKDAKALQKRFKNEKVIFGGNLMYDYTDAVNASIEIARRGFEYRIKKNKTGFFPKLLVKRQWKEMVTNHTDWKKKFILK